MTDKLKERIEEEISFCDYNIGLAPITGNDVSTIARYLKSLQALLFAVETHGHYPDYEYCMTCVEGRDSEPVKYPCNFVKGTAERLGVEL
jgi:hypothetical protein